MNIVASTEKTIFTWPDDEMAVVEQIRARRSRLKLVVKSRNESKTLAAWLEYHCPIASPEGIVIFDNMSDDPDTLEFYAALPPEIILVHYSGFHNYLHNVSLFPTLYRALSLSCDFYSFIDTDERLSLVFENRHFGGHELAYFLKGQMHHPVIPASWMNNAIGSTELFKVGRSSDILAWGLAWGKPVIRSTANVSNIILHNTELSSNFYSYNTPLNLFCLHLKNLDPQHRIRMNVAKLVARGFAAPGDTANDVLARDASLQQDGMIQIYLDEIRRLLAPNVALQEPLAPEYVRFSSQHQLEYPSFHERHCLTSFIGHAAKSNVKKVLIEKQH